MKKVFMMFTLSLFAVAVQARPAAKSLARQGVAAAFFEMKAGKKAAHPKTAGDPFEEAKQERMRAQLYGFKKQDPKGC